MIRILAFLGFLLAAMPALATQAAVPGLYAVTGVAEDDVLNVRRSPTAAAPILGTLPPAARNVEVVELSRDQGWGRVNVAGASGWASMTFLRPMQNEFQGRFPSPARCFGTEPFWSVDIGGDTVTLSRAGDPTVAFSAGDRTTAVGRRDRWSLRAFRDGQSLTVVIGTQICSDGMSDHLFGLTGDVIVSTEGGHRFVSGCCSLAR